METKKCPKCGAEIPVEMSFCLHCMERTDGVLEIKKKAAPNRKLRAAVIIMFVLMTAVIILLIWQFIGRNDGENNESQTSQIPQETTEQVTEQTSSTISYEVTTTAAESKSELVHTEMPTTAVSGIPKKTSDISESKIDNNNFDDNNESENISSEINVNEEKNDDISSAESSYTESENNPVINFEELFTERLNGWGASHVLTDTLSFSENGCTFTSNVGTDKVNCTVSANAEMTDFTLIIEPATEYTSYATAVYIPDIVNEITYFVLEYKMSSSMRTEIGLMFENFESDGSFAENTLHCDISTQAHNGGSYPITINCRID